MRGQLDTCLISSLQHLGWVVKTHFPQAERFLLKVNWSTVGPGSFTDAQVLGRVLSVLPGEKLVLEGHSFGRRYQEPPSGGSANLEFFREQDRLFRAREGIDSVLASHGARYVNVSEEIWEGRTVPADEVRERVHGKYGPLHHSEIYGYLPEILDQQRDRTLFLNLAKIKTSVSGREWSLVLKNMFGLLPDVLRLKYHPTLPLAILDITRVYLSSFPVLGLAESLYALTVYDSQGEHSAGWSRYSVKKGGGFMMAGTDLVDLEMAVAGVYSLPIFDRTLLRKARQLLGDEKGED